MFSFRDKVLRLTKILKNEIGDNKNDQSLKWFVDIAGVSYSPFLLDTYLLLLSIVMKQERKLFLISSQWLNGNLAELTYIDGILSVFKLLQIYCKVYPRTCFKLKFDYLNKLSSRLDEAFKYWKGITVSIWSSSVLTFKYNTNFNFFS